MDFEERLKAIESRLERIEAYLPSSDSAVITEPGDARLEEQSVAHLGESFDLTLAGKSILILGGAVLLRAATESATLPAGAGVAAGLVYAASWIVAAIVAARRQRRLTAIFYAATSACVAYPLVWEAVTRFHVLGGVSAAFVAGVFSIALIAEAKKVDLLPLAWIAAAGATVDALLLSYATSDVVPFLIELTVLGIVATIAAETIVAALFAIESDLLAAFLIGFTLIRSLRTSTTAIAALLAFGLLWLAFSRLQRAQAIAASAFGFGGAAMLVAMQHVSPLAAGLLMLSAAGFAFGAALYAGDDLLAISAAIAALSGSAILLQGNARTIVWAGAALVAAELARRKSSPVFAAQSALWGLLAVSVGGLFSFTVAVLLAKPAVIPITALVATMFCLAAFLRQSRWRLVLLVIVVCGAAALTVDAASLLFAPATSSGQALLRTLVLATGAVALAFVGRFMGLREASQVAAALLVLIAVKLVAHDVRVGSAAMLFVTLAVYGGAMIAIAKLRRGSVVIR
jgi:hypothetical protein